LDARIRAWYRQHLHETEKLVLKGIVSQNQLAAVSENQQLNKAGYYERFF
jgi:hypothetical protein